MKDFKDRYKDIALPSNIDNIINSSIEKGKRVRKRKPLVFFSSLASFITVFIVLVNTFPAFAATMSKIPIVGALVEVVKFDKGIKYAIDKGYVQQVNESKEVNGVKVTITKLIGDKRKILIGYKIDDDTLDLGRAIIKGNEDINCSYGVYRDNTLDKKLRIEKENFFSVDFMDKHEEIKEVNIEIKLIKKDEAMDNYIEGNWSFKIPINEELLKVNGTEYAINKNIQSENIDINIEKINIYTTAIDLYINIDESKGHSYVYMSEAHLEDSKGNIYRSQGSRKSGDKVVHRFEGGNYSSKDKLTLKSDGIYYMPEKEQYIIVDLKENKIIEDSGYNIRLLDINRVKEETKILFDMSGEKDLKSISFSTDSGDYERIREEFQYEGDYYSNYGLIFAKELPSEGTLKLRISSVMKYKTSPFSLELIK